MCVSTVERRGGTHFAGASAVERWEASRRRLVAPRGVVDQCVVNVHRQQELPPDDQLLHLRPQQTGSEKPGRAHSPGPQRVDRRPSALGSIGVPAPRRRRRLRQPRTFATIVASPMQPSATAAVCCTTGRADRSTDANVAGHMNSVCFALSRCSSRDTTTHARGAPAAEPGLPPARMRSHVAAAEASSACSCHAVQALWLRSAESPPNAHADARTGMRRRRHRHRHARTQRTHNHTCISGNALAIIYRIILQCTCDGTAK